MISSAEIYKLAERHLGSDSHIFSDESFDADMNVVRGECKDKALAFIHAVIAANNAKVLKDLKPDVTEEEITDMCVAGGAKVFVNYYSTETVSALIQERDALAARVKELEAQSKQAIKDALEEAAILCDQTPKLEAYSAGIAVQDHCANKIRKLKDQL